MNPSRGELEKEAREALCQAKDPPRRLGSWPPAPRQQPESVSAGFAGAAMELPSTPTHTACSPRARWRWAEARYRVPGRRRHRAPARRRGRKPAEAIHEARKDIKKIRSALRLIREQDRRRRLAPGERPLSRGGREPERLSRRRDPGRGSRRTVGAIRGRGGGALRRAAGAARVREPRRPRRRLGRAGDERAAAGLTAGRGRIDSSRSMATAGS